MAGMCNLMEQCLLPDVGVAVSGTVLTIIQ